MPRHPARSKLNNAMRELREAQASMEHLVKTTRTTLDANAIGVISQMMRSVGYMWDVLDMMTPMNEEEDE